MTAKEIVQVGTPEGIAFLGAQVKYQQGWRLVECQIPPEMQDGWELQTPAGKGRAYVVRGSGDYQADNEAEAWVQLFLFGGVENPAINLIAATQLVSGLAWQIYNGVRSKYVEVNGQRVECEGDAPEQLAAALVLAWWRGQLA